jgi:hypothetical protein
MFFVKMAALIVSTIVLSYIYSLGFFMSLLLVMGPEHNQGNVGAYFEKIKSKVNTVRTGSQRVAAEEVNVAP